MSAVRDMPTTTDDQERAIMALLRERTLLQRKVRPILDEIEEVNAKLEAIFAAQKAWPAQ